MLPFDVVIGSNNTAIAKYLIQFYDLAYASLFKGNMPIDKYGIKSAAYDVPACPTLNLMDTSSSGINAEISTPQAALKINYLEDSSSTPLDLANSSFTMHLTTVAQHLKLQLVDSSISIAGNPQFSEIINHVLSPIVNPQITPARLKPLSSLSGPTLAFQGNAALAFFALGDTSPDVPSAPNSWPSGLFMSVDSNIVAAEGVKAIRSYLDSHAIHVHGGKSTFSYDGNFRIQNANLSNVTIHSDDNDFDATLSGTGNGTVTVTTNSEKVPVNFTFDFTAPGTANLAVVDGELFITFHHIGYIKVNIPPPEWVPAWIKLFLNDLTDLLINNLTAQLKELLCNVPIPVRKMVFSLPPIFGQKFRVEVDSIRDEFHPYPDNPLLTYSVNLKFCRA